MWWHGHNRWGCNCIAHTRSHYWLEISQSCSGGGTYLGWWYHRLTKEHENTTVSDTLTWYNSPSHLWFKEWLVRDKQPTENWILGVIHGTKPKSPQMYWTLLPYSSMKAYCEKESISFTILVLMEYASGNVGIQDNRYIFTDSRISQVPETRLPSSSWWNAQVPSCKDW